MGKPQQAFDPIIELGEHGFERSLEHGPGVYITSPDADHQDWNIGEIEVVRLGNPDLPVHAYKENILEAVADNPVTIVVAETGAGKSTQIPQYLLEAGYKTVYVTQPRRAAARNVFSRIRDEITEVRGMFAGDQMVSYQTAGEHDGPKDAAIKVVTDGLQLVHELHDKGVIEEEVLVLDEVHEWNSNVEVLVAWTKRAIKKNPDLRVVIMSATMDAEHLADYYAEVCGFQPPILEIPGRMYSVERAEKPESTVSEEVLKIVNALSDQAELPDGPNGILVFEPGKREILDLIDELQARIPEDSREKVKIFPLHAKLSPYQQQEAITQYPDCIKIVVATEVAQTSLTIPDIRYVVDSGYQRRIEVDHEGTRGLQLNPISQADCNQRAGRTGRVSDGHYILTRMNTTTPHVLYEDRDEYPMPEILRTDIARNALRLKALGIEIADFDMYHKAAHHILTLADVNLVLLDALDEQGNITHSGYEMNRYPLCTSSARIMVESARYSELTRAYLAAIVSSKEIGGLQYFAHNVGKRWQELSQEENSDLLVQLDLFIAAQDMTLEEIIAHDLDVNNVQRAREQYVKVAQLAGASGDKLEPPTPEEREHIRHCLYAGYLPSIYRLEGDTYVHASNKSITTPREISNRSLVTTTPPFIIGDPYRVELIDNDEATQRHLIENVTAVSVVELGALVASRVVWKLEDYVVREGKFYEKQRQHLLGIDLGLVQEVPATPAPKLRHEIIAHAIEKPGAEQKKLRQMKRELEGLAHRSKVPIRKLTHDRIIELVHEAAPDDITTPAIIEDNLRAMMADPDSGLSLDDFVSPEQREEIIRSSPIFIEVEKTALRVNYRNGTPLVNIHDPATILNLNASELLLEDGREVLFIYKNPDARSRKYTLSEIKYRFSNIGWNS